MHFLKYQQRKFISLLYLLLMTLLFISKISLLWMLDHIRIKITQLAICNHLFKKFILHIVFITFQPFGNFTSLHRTNAAQSGY